MTMPAGLLDLGDALERAAADELAASPRWRRVARSRRFVAVLAAVAVLAPVAAVAASRLIGGHEVAQSMPAGAAIFAGTEATCTVVVPNVEYHCVLDRPPFPEVQDFKGVVEATVDKTKHVNGGCRGLTSDGLVWQCYLGEEAVRQQIVSQSFLGGYAPGPGHG
jgi:hypothetical protein